MGCEQRNTCSFNIAITILSNKMNNMALQEMCYGIKIKALNVHIVKGLSEEIFGVRTVIYNIIMAIILKSNFT